MLRGDVKDRGATVGGKAHALDLLHDVIGKLALEEGEYEARALDVLARVELQRCEVLVRSQQGARLHTG